MKKKAAVAAPPEVLESFGFKLPWHMRFNSPADALADGFQHVTGNLYRWPEIKIKTSAAEPLTIKEGAKKVVQSLTPPHGKDVVTAAANAEKALSVLANMARDGDGKALWQFAAIVSGAVGGLNQIATSNPDAIKPFARTIAGWPLARSTAPHLCDDDSLLEKIELGKSVGIQLDKYSKWKPGFESEVAFELIKCIEFKRQENPIVLNSGKKIRFSKLVLPFSKDSAPHWWHIAKMLLLHSYPKLEKIPELDALVTAKTKRKYASTRSNSILEKIRARFFHLAK